MVVRLAPGNPAELGGQLGLHTGPRLSVPVVSRSGGPGSSSFAGDTNLFAMPQWGLAYDLGLTQPLTPATSLHLGVQGEFGYPIPLPAYGLYTGVSHYVSIGRVSLAPAATARFATDFGIPSFGGPGTLLGGDLSLTLGWHPEDRFAVGLVPFVSHQHLWTGPSQSYALYVGAALVARLKLSGGCFEVSGGFGRVFMPSIPAWTTPILGISASR
jgi:hypothetical protein